MSLTLAASSLHLVLLRFGCYRRAASVSCFAVLPISETYGYTEYADTLTNLGVATAAHTIEVASSFPDQIMGEHASSCNVTLSYTLYNK